MVKFSIYQLVIYSFSRANTRLSCSWHNRVVSQCRNTRESKGRAEEQQRKDVTRDFTSLPSNHLGHNSRCPSRFICLTVQKFNICSLSESPHWWKNVTPTYDKHYTLFLYSLTGIPIVSYNSDFVSHVQQTDLFFYWAYYS